MYDGLKITEIINQNVNLICNKMQSNCDGVKTQDEKTLLRC